MRLVERAQAQQSVAKQSDQTDRKAEVDPKALACYGLYAHLREEDGNVQREVWLRFVDGRPVGEVTCRYLQWRRWEAGGVGQDRAVVGLG